MDNSLIAGMPEVIAYIKKIEEENKDLKEENKKLNFQVDALDKQATEFCLKNGDLKEENEKLKMEMEKLNENYVPLEDYEKLNQKATAWKIINRADWGYLRELCDKEMCKDLIECGECNEEDFEGYDIYEEEEEWVCVTVIIFYRRMIIIFYRRM